MLFGKAKMNTQEEIKEASVEDLTPTDWGALKEMAREYEHAKWLRKKFFLWISILALIPGLFWLIELFNKFFALKK
jgi:hypothetical protein